MKDPHVKHNKGILGSLECILWNTEFLLWALFISSTWHMLAMTIERYLRIKVERPAVKVDSMEHLRDPSTMALYCAYYN